MIKTYTDAKTGKEFRVDIPEDYFQRLKAIAKDDEDAIKIYLEDEGILTNVEQENLDEKAKKNKSVKNALQIETKAKGQHKKHTVVENENKVKVMQMLFSTIQEFDSNATLTNATKYIDFAIDNEKFTLNLVQHREPKKK